MTRKYEKVKVLLPVVQQLQAEGKTRKEIAREGSTWDGDTQRKSGVRR